MSGIFMIEYLYLKKEKGCCLYRINWAATENV